KEPPVALTQLEPGVPKELGALGAKAMARAPSGRYPTAKEFSDDLKKFQTGQLVGAHQYTRGALLWRWVRRYRVQLTAALITLISVATVSAIAFRSVVVER